MLLGNVFLPSPVRRTAHRVFNKININKDNNQSFIAKLEHILEHKIAQAARFIRVSLANMPKKDLKSLAALINSSILADEEEAFTIWYKLILDIIETKLYKSPPPEKVKTLPKYRISLPFTNKAMDFINLPQIIRSDEARKNMPSSLNENDIPMVVYSLSQPIRSRILNYKKFVSQLDLDAFNNDNNIIPCHCARYGHTF